MNKIFFNFWIIFFICLTCAVDASSNIELRGAAFYPASSKFREVYGDVRPNYQIEISTQWNCSFDVWANFDWFSQKHHKNHGCCDCKTRIEIPNISTGIKYFFPLECVCSDLKCYLGLGIGLGRVYLKNKSCCSDDTWKEIAVGGVLKSGIHYYFCQNVFLDLFADYIYQPVHIHKHVDIGGLKFGLGLGLRF